MRPHTLTLCGWGPYPDREQVDFEPFMEKGIFLIAGATGAGKTTLFDAISYALYGALSGEERDRERASVRSDFVDPQMPTYVELVMEHGGAIYQIRRNPEYLRPKKRGGADAYTKEKENAILTCPDGKVLEGVREVNAALQELLVLDYQQFKKISMIAQGEFARLLVASPKDKTKIFREIFGTGVCERFTQNLGKRSRELERQVAEQQHKQEEDIRLLLTSLRTSPLAQEPEQTQEQEGQARTPAQEGQTQGGQIQEGQIQEGQAQADQAQTAQSQGFSLYLRLIDLTKQEYWNDADILDCLQKLEQISRQQAELRRSTFRRADAQVEEQTLLLAAAKQDNQQIKQLEDARANNIRLAEQADDYKDREARYQQALNAGFVEGSEERLRQLTEQLEACYNQQKQENLQIETLRQEQQTLAPVVAASESLRELIRRKQQLQEKQQELDTLQGKLTRLQKRLEKAQTDYLRGEESFRAAKGAYEEAERLRRLSAIGLAATLLVEGDPCPVCGSTTHPNPATLQVTPVTEEALEELKHTMEQQERSYQTLHEQAVTLRTQLQGLQEENGKLQEQCNQLASAFQEEPDDLQREYLSLEPTKAIAQLKKRCDRAGSLAGLLQEKAAQQQRLTLQQEQLQQAKQEAEEQWQQALVQYGFAQAEDYRQARLTKQQREDLKRQIETYRNQVTACAQLCRHLAETVGEKQKKDLTLLEQQLQQEKEKKATALQEQKSWEHCQKDIHRTLHALQEKQGSMEQSREEYGYVKDLENLASGNNKMRLVFEQYVLASYFEEILRAANLRFRQMTSGRYEMSRVSQVGDGRVKDSLEIQVLDYYTGKYRSVRTLSGGESFKASLALALGMSDVIQAMNGGIRVDTLFIDEGFGALDAESLEQACSTLMSLAERDRLIGIISHVPELRERIDRQLIIEKTNHGSRITNQ